VRTSLAIDEDHPKVTQIGIFDFNRPTNLDESPYTNYSFYILGCEDCEQTGSNTSGGNDSDYNDCVFMLVGHVPQVVYNDVEVTTTISKRYMIEDLASFDYDFNDIVVDCEQTTTNKYKLNTQTGETTLYSGYPIISQAATVQHLCGTLPFQVYIGGYTFGRVTDPSDVELASAQLAKDADALESTQLCGTTTKGCNPAYYVELCANVGTSGIVWNPSENNIGAYVWTDKNLANNSDSESVWQTSWSNPGEVPYIIATDVTTKWTAEDTPFLKTYPAWTEGTGTYPSTTSSTTGE